MNGKYGKPLLCHLISTETVIEVEYWRVCSEKRCYNDPWICDSQRVINPRPKASLLWELCTGVLGFCECSVRRAGSAVQILCGIFALNTSGSLSEVLCGFS
jgi:hypothetical protein